jgi:hypothetical protein
MCNNLDDVTEEGNMEVKEANMKGGKFRSNKISTNKE